MPLKIVRDTYQDSRKAYEAKLILVRPDRYVAWASDGAPPDAAAVIAKVVGRDNSGGVVPFADSLKPALVSAFEGRASENVTDQMCGNWRRMALWRMPTIRGESLPPEPA